MRGTNGSSLSNLITKIAGAICMIAGLITVWMPIPTGLILMAIGLTLLIASSPTIAAWARLMRKRYQGLDAHLNRAEPYLPSQMRRVLSRTRPNKSTDARFKPGPGPQTESS